MTAVRRFLVFATLLFWQGGFTFYTAVVVPIGTEILDSAEEQGRITRRVTVDLNLAGLFAVAALGWDIATSTDPVQRRRLLRWLMWGCLAVTLGLLFWLHGRLDALLDVAEESILDRSRFRLLHRGYLWTSTLQWACGVASIWWTLRAWQAEDRQSHRTG